MDQNDLDELELLRTIEAEVEAAEQKMSGPSVALFFMKKKAT